jgi:hypothetical protein
MSLCLFSLSCLVCRYPPCDGLIPPPTDCVEEQEAVKAAKVQQKVVEPWIDSTPEDEIVGVEMSRVNIQPQCRVTNSV